MLGMWAESNPELKRGKKMKTLKHLAFCLVILAWIHPGPAHGDTANREAFSPILASAGKTVPADSAQAEFDGNDELFDEAPVPEPDPLALWNLAVYYFNDTFYFGVTKPVVSAYRALFPKPIRTGVRNFFYNIAGPGRMINCLLQGKGQAAEAEFIRFCMNTTVGVLGFGNPAGKFKTLNPPAEDLGQSLGVFGFGEGVFIMWPVLGPSTFRDSIGMVGDWFLHPVTYIDPTETAMAITAYETVNDTSFRIGDYESLKEAAIEPYEALKDAYIQYRRKKVTE